MGVSTHLGPWLLGTVKDGSVNNLGATSVVQIITDVDNSANTFYLPAGFAVLRAYSYFTTPTTDAAATVTWTINGVALTTAALGAGNRRVDLSFTALSPAQIAALFNTTGGTGSLTCTVASNSGAGPQQTTNVIEYVVRLGNGSYRRVP